MDILILLVILFFLSLSIILFDLDLAKAKKFGDIPTNEPNLPKWTLLFYWIGIGTWIAILFINWKVAFLGVIIYYASAFIPLPQMIGNVLMSPFKSKIKK